MAKIKVTLTAVYDDGKTQLHPGDVVSMESALAARLLDLGMVKFVPIKKSKEIAQADANNDDPLANNEADAGDNADVDADADADADGAEQNHD